MTINGYLDRLFPGRKLQRVILVNPPDASGDLFRSDTARRRRYSSYPPYGLLTLARHLLDMGLAVQICDLNHHILKSCQATDTKADFRFEQTWRERLDAIIANFNPDLIGVTCMFSMTYPSFKNVCAHIAGKGIPLAAGGVYVSNDIENIFKDLPQIDLVFSGEGEVALTRFVNVVNGELASEEVVQLIANDRGKFLRFPRRKLPDAEKISVLPAYDLILLSEYSKLGTIGAFYCFKPPGSRFATVLSNRGCRANCSFCSVRGFNGPGVRQRSVDSVVDELTVLQDQFGIDHIVWLDDDFLFNHKRAVSLFNEMVKRQLKLTWDATNGVMAASCRLEVIAAAAASGCIALNIGVESGNPQILRSTKKPATVETYLAAAEVLRQFPQIHASVFLIIGFPDETLAMIYDTINLARQMDLDWYRISILEPLPNTPVYDAMVQQGLIRDDASDPLRFMGGAYGKQAEIEQGARLVTRNFREAFQALDPNAVPAANQLTDIWFYMNYHLNFNRLFSETRPLKIKQLMQHLTTLGDVISPENGFALYFLGYLQYKTSATIDPAIIKRLKSRLAGSAYWRDRFEAFGLSLGDLVKCDFGHKEISLSQ